MQETAISVQFVLGMRFHRFDFALYRWPSRHTLPQYRTPRRNTQYQYRVSVPCLSTGHRVGLYVRAHRSYRTCVHDFHSDKVSVGHHLVPAYARVSTGHGVAGA
eukprot:3460178-Rhodomonas_salina.2